MRGFLKKILCFSVAVVLNFSFSMPSFAVDTCDEYTPGSSEYQKCFMDIAGPNNILFYDPSGTSCESVALGAFDGNASAGLSDLQAAFVDSYHDIAENLSVEYGIPWETVIAQGILESAAGMSKFARDRNNFFGIGAFDSNPNNAYSYDTMRI